MLLETTAGRLIFNQSLPEDFGFVNYVLKKKEVTTLVERLATEYPKAVVAETLDAIKNLGFRYAAQSGLSISINDVQTPVAKREILDRHETEALALFNSLTAPAGATRLAPAPVPAGRP